ncbi:KilA-N domain-containing protein [Enterobacter cancerogenus]
MKELKLFDYPVRVNDEGMICLTDMWQIAKLRAEAGDDNFLGGRDINSIRPSQFARLDSTKLFIKELSKCDLSTHLKTVRGKHGGTFGSRYVAYEFAGHIDPAFKVGVYTVVDKFLSGEMVTMASYMAEANMADHIYHEEASVVSDAARTMNYWGVGGRKRHLTVKRQEAYEKLQVKIPGLPS